MEAMMLSSNGLYAGLPTVECIKPVLDQPLGHVLLSLSPLWWHPLCSHHKTGYFYPPLLLLLDSVPCVSRGGHWTKEDGFIRGAVQCSWYGMLKCHPVLSVGYC